MNFHFTIEIQFLLAGVTIAIAGVLLFLRRLSRPATIGLIGIDDDYGEVNLRQNIAHLQFIVKTYKDNDSTWMVQCDAVIDCREKSESDNDGNSRKLPRVDNVLMVSAPGAKSNHVTEIIRKNIAPLFHEMNIRGESRFKIC